MKSREWFALAVRIAGLVSLLYALAGTLMLFGGNWFYAVRMILWLAFSLWLIRGAPQLVRFAYSGEE